MVFVYDVGGAVVVVGGTVVDGMVPLVADVVDVDADPSSTVVVVVESATTGTVLVGDVDGFVTSTDVGDEMGTVTRAAAPAELNCVGASVTCERTLPTAAVAMTTATRVAASHATRNRILPRMMTV